MKKGAIFDLDGTLVSTIGLHERAWKELFLKYNIILTDAELKEQSGKRNILFINSILERKNVAGLNSEKLSNEKDEIVKKYLENNRSAVFNGVEELLDLLKKQGIKLALATSATQETAIFLGGDLLNFFDAKIFAEDVQFGKPHPEVFLKAAQKLGLESSDCIVFEDAQSGIEAAKAGGFFCIAKDNGLGQNTSKADFVISEYNPSELIKFFQ